MSGNSKDRRKFGRAIELILAERVLGFQQLTEQTSPSIEQKLWSWPAVGIAVTTFWAIGGIAITAPTPLIVPDSLFVTGSILLLAKFFMWSEFWRAPTKIRWRSSSIMAIAAVLPTLVLFGINHRTPPFTFPWISTADQSNDEIGLQVIIRDYPLDPSLNTVGSRGSLFHPNLIVSRIVSVSKQGESRHAQVVASLSEQEWSNELGHRVLAWIPVNKPVVLDVWGTSRDAHWEGYIILRKDKGRIQRLEAMSGTMAFPRVEGRLALTEEVTAEPSGRLQKRISHEFHALTKQELMGYGIPES